MRKIRDFSLNSTTDVLVPRLRPGNALSWRLCLPRRHESSDVTAGGACNSLGSQARAWEPDSGFRRSSRRGSAIVEFAVMSQIVLLILFGTIDVCSLYYLRQSAKLAAYEGCRIGLTASGTDLLVSNQATRILNARRIAGFTITTSPAVAALTPGQLLTVRLSVPSSINLPLRGWFTGSAPVITEVKMASEK